MTEAVRMADTRRLPGPNADMWDWQLEGSCRGMDSASFFHPDGERGPARARREARAKAVCLSCPVLEMCRSHALAVHEPYGIWGGLSESERENIIKSDKRALSMSGG
ncbi:WhiB family transcriptional regulator [Amycolatopsis vastitatis]|jgi:WhiB family redox-sensing transcriptional regulator|uniref:Transcriptional regulator WhiB n=2 Tax=Pseudonocardiaceae TaxID=2070 RepID=A0A229T8C5_9PSEU|nr:WhiB family transcriptional regulator [Amycolatopsis vastitatis]